MDRSVQAETQTTPVGEEHRSLLREAFHAGASYAFGEKSKTTDAITTYAPDALYTGALFFPGTKALVASAAIGALNEVRTDSSWQDTAKDAVLGSAKGAGTKFVFDKIGAVEFTKSVLNAPIKGVVMGSASTLINSALSRSTYEKDGKFDFETGLSRTANSVLSPQALAINAATFGFASSASVGLNRLTGGLLSRSAGLSMLATGGTFGIASGGIQEFSRQTASGESFDVSKIASQALIHGAIDGLAAVPAGFKVGFAPRPRSDFGPQKSAETIPQLTLRSSETDTVQPNERPKGDGSGDRATDSKKPTSTIEPTTYEATMQNGSSIKIEFSRSHEHTPEAEPKEIITTDSAGQALLLTRIGMHESGHSEWKIEDNFGNSFNVQADVKVPSDGKLSVSGKEIELAYHTADEVVSLFVTKPDITPGIKAQIEQMEKILTPLNNPRVSIDEANQAYSAIHSFARDHRGPALEAEIVEWIKSQPAASQRILNRYYSDPINESVRQSDFLSKTTFSMVRKGLIKPDVIDYITRFPDKIEESTRLTDEQKAKTLKNVLQLLDNGSDPKASPDSRTAPFGMYQIAAIQSAMHVAEPDTVTQYAHPTCAMASLEVSAYTRTPDVATDLVSQVLRTGKFVAGDGTVIKIDPLSMRPERGSESINRVAFNQYSNKDVFRSYASQIFQTTAQNVFWQTRTRNPDGDRVPKGSLRYELHFGTRPGVEGTPTGFVVDYSGKRPKYWEAEGYRDEDINATSDLISDRLRHRPIPSSALKTFDTFKDWLARAPREDMPVSIGVDARYLSESLKGEPDILGHAINIHASFDPVEPGGGDKWMVAIKNPWDGRTKFITIPELWKMAYERDHFKGPMGQTSKTMVPVSRSNFEAATGKLQFIGLRATS